MNKRESFILAQKVRAAQEIAKLKKNQKLECYPTRLSLPIGVQFELTAKCNLFCKHCYNRSYMERESKMTVNDWLAVTQDIIEHGGIFQCILSGGEPLLLGNDLFTIMNPLQENGTGFVLITNGFLVTPEIVSKLKKYDYYWVQVSIDHLLEKEHDLFRGKEGSWKRAKQAALLFSSAGFPLRIAHSLTPQSLEYLEEFAEFSYNLGASSLICGEIMLSGRVDEHRELLMNTTDYEIMYSKIEKLKKIYQGKMDILVSAPELVEMRKRQKTINSSIIIRPDGNVRLDCTMPFVIGNVLRNKFSDIWKQKGNICWKHPLVENYISELEKYDRQIERINHVMSDIEI